MNQDVMELLLDEVTRFGEQAAAGKHIALGGLSKEMRTRRKELAKLLLMKAWFGSIDADWQQYLVYVLVGYVDALERLSAAKADNKRRTTEVERSLRMMIGILDQAAESMEAEIDVTIRNRLAAEAVCKCLDWNETDAVVAFVYWQTGEMLTKSNADTSKSRLLKELARYLEARHD